MLSYAGGQLCPLLSPSVSSFLFRAGCVLLDPSLSVSLCLHFSVRICMSLSPPVPPSLPFSVSSCPSVPFRSSSSKRSSSRGVSVLHVSLYVSPFCSIEEEKGGIIYLSVSAFGGLQLDVSPPSSSSSSKETKKRHRGALQRLFADWFSGPDSRRGRLSRADPSNLLQGLLPAAAAAAAASSELSLSEDDVLHLKCLPSFGGRLPAADAELLLQFLTAPYLRIPLMLQFFGEGARIECLSCPVLQQVVAAALFEPWHFQQDPTAVAAGGGGSAAGAAAAGAAAAAAAGGICDVAPPPSRECLATPVGLLFNELLLSPHSVLTALEALLDLALEKDTGSHTSAAAAALLFVVRLTAHVLSYLRCLLRHRSFWRDGWQPVPIPLSHQQQQLQQFQLQQQQQLRHQLEHEPSPAAAAAAAAQPAISIPAAGSSSRSSRSSSSSSRVSGCGFAAAVRGLGCSEETAQVLQSYLERLSRRLSGEVVPLLRLWVQRALDSCDLAAACSLHAHLLLIARDVLWEDLNPQNVAEIVSSLFFLFAHHPFSGEHPSLLSLQLMQHQQQQQAISRSNNSNSSSSGAATGGRGGGTAGGETAAAAGTTGDTAAAEAAAGEALGVSDAEIFQILQQHRLLLIRWLDVHADEAGGVLETAIQAVTFAGTRMSAARAAAAAATTTAAATAAQGHNAAAAALAACAAAANALGVNGDPATPSDCTTVTTATTAATAATATAATAATGGNRRWRAQEGLGVSGRYIPAAAAAAAAAGSANGSGQETGEETSGADAAAAAEEQRQQQQQEQQHKSGGVGLLRGAVVAVHAAMKRSTLRLLGGETPQSPAAAGQAAAYAESLKASLAMESEVQANLQVRTNHHLCRCCRCRWRRKRGTPSPVAAAPRGMRGSCCWCSDRRCVVLLDDMPVRFVSVCCWIGVYRQLSCLSDRITCSFWATGRMPLGIFCVSLES